MTHRVMKLAMVILATSVVTISMARGESLTQALSFEAECLDLDSGAVVESCRNLVREEPEAETWDIVIGFHGDRAVHAVVAPNPAAGIGIAYLRDREFDGVTAADVETVSFDIEPEDVQFDSAMVILVRTDLGAVYKVGRPIEGYDSVTFDYELIAPAP